MKSGRDIATEERIAAKVVTRREALTMGLGLATAMVGAGALLETGAGSVLAKGTRRPTLLGSAAPGADNVVLQWNSAALRAIYDLHLGPTVRARSLAIVHTAIFDAWSAYDAAALGTRFRAALRRPSSERSSDNKNQAISFAAYRALVDQFPSELSVFKDLMTALSCDPGDTSMDPTKPSGIGNLTAQAILDARHGDGSNQLGDLHPGGYSDYLGYGSVNDPDHLNDPSRWQPLRVSDGHGGFVAQRCITPQWALVTPFALTSGAQFRAAIGPATYPSPRYEQQAMTLLRYSASLSETHKVIAEYWADGPSPNVPHEPIWNLIGQFVSRRDGHDVDADVKMFFGLTNAMADAVIAVWNTKMVFDSVRPVSAIHYLFKGKRVKAWGGPGTGTRVINGEEWQPYIETPAFPEFVSNHSAVSAASAEVLRAFTGSDTFGASFTKTAGTSRIEPHVTPAADVTLRWDTFSDAANQAGMSRRYGGIHFVKADMVGRALGRLVGRQAWDRAQTYIAGQ